MLNLSALQWSAKRATKPLFSLRVGFLHSFVQSFDADVGVDLGCGEARVTEKLLHRLEVSTAIEQVGGEGVPKSVRGGIGRKSDRERPPFDDFLNRSRGEPQPFIVRKEGIVGGWFGSLASNIISKRGGGGRAKKRDAFLVAFADHSDRTIFEIQILLVEADSFGGTESGGVNEFEDCAVALGGSSHVLLVKEVGGLRLVEALGEVSASKRGFEWFGGIAINDLGCAEVFGERADRGKFSGPGSGAAAVFAQILPQSLGIEVECSVGENCELVEVGPVGSNGCLGSACAEVVQEALDLIVHRSGSAVGHWR